MALSEQARERLADVVALQPTKNADLQERWGVESGSEVHAYLEAELSEYYYRDEDSLVRATPEAADLVDVDPGVEEGPDGRIVRVPELQARAFEVLPGPDGNSKSVVAVLHALRDAFDTDPTAEEVRSALRALERKGVVEVVRRTVPTFRLAVERESVDVERLD
jgi:chromosome condensin MukBEF MukE localization factor